MVEEYWTENSVAMVRDYNIQSLELHFCKPNLLHSLQRSGVVDWSTTYTEYHFCVSQNPQFQVQEAHWCLNRKS